MVPPSPFSLILAFELYLLRTSGVAYQIQYEIVKKGKRKREGWGRGGLKKALRTTFMFVV
jgi:hypothetical protein